MSSTEHALCLEGLELWRFGRVFRFAQLAHRINDAFGFGSVPRIAFTAGEAEGDGENNQGAGQSAGFGGGPIWIRSPMYEPMRVKNTPRALMSTYMNGGIVFTV